MSRRRPGLVGMVLAALVLAGCDDPLAPPTADRAALAAATREIEAAAPPRANGRTPAEDRAMVARAVARLTPVADGFCRQERREPCRFRVRVVDAPVANAFASGRDDVAITTGMLRLLDNEDEVAAVLAHEFAHHIAGHIAEGTLRTQAGAIAGHVLGSVAQEYIGMDLGLSRLGAEAGARAGRLSFSKRDEREADYLAAFILARAGYDLDRAAGLWAKLTRLSGDKTTSLLDSHPAGPERLAVWRRTAEEIRAAPQAPPRRAR